MSWEVISETVEKCKCGKGVIVSIFEMDDWNNSRSTTSIDCKDCYKKVLDNKINSYNCNNSAKHDNTEYHYIEKE